jgi:hypothetical protein
MRSHDQLPARLLATVLTGVLLVSVGSADAADPVGPKLTPRLKDLVTQEMRLIAGASAEVFQAIVTGDHATVAARAHQIHESFIIKQSLTDQDKADLKAAVPPEFLALDGEFHGASAKLAEAAQAQDVAQELELFAQMTQTCVACHAAYANDRFPTLATE